MRTSLHTILSGKWFFLPALFLLASVFVFFAPRDVAAQSSAANGQIGGQVLDPSGAAVADVEVSGRNIDTNYTRFTTTNAEGRYAIGPVPLGTYEITVKPANMESSSQQVYVSLGGRANADFQLGMQPVRESIDVRADAPAVIEPTQTFSKAVLTELQLRNIPAPGRRIKNLFLLTPSTQIEPECGGFSISGQKGVYTSFNVDGGDYTSSHYCGHVEMTPTISVEAIKELQVLRSTFSAEFGRSTGGIVNLATKSGTNLFHGTGFYLARNESLTKVDPFDREQIGMGQQFGGSLGGPIRKDRTFFFSAAEFQYNNKPIEVLYEQLDLQNLRGTAGGQTLLSIASEQGLTSSSELQSTVNRLDHSLNEKNNLSIRFDFTRNSISGVIGSFINTNGLGAGSITNRDLTNAAPTSNRTNFTGMVQHTAVLSPRTVNELRYAVASEFRPWDPGNGPEVTVNNAGQTIAIYGPQGTGLSYGNVGYKFSDRRNQFIDNFSLITGAHTMKLGFDANLVNSEVRFNPGYNGVYRFDSLTGYLNREPGSYTQFAGSGVTTPIKHQIAFYVQDEWRVGGGLTLSPGFRYEMALLPDYEPATLPSRRFATEPIPDDKEMYGPRMGLAWDIRQNAKTVLRAAAGVFYAPPYITLWEQSIVFNGGNPELGKSVSLANLTDIRNAFNSQGINLSNAALNALPVFSADQLGGLPNSTASVYYMEPDFRLARSFQYRVAVEQEIASGLTASVDYTTINTTRMDRVRDTNLPVPVRDSTGRPVFTPSAQVSLNSLRPNQNYAQIYITESSARGFYRGMTASMNLRRSRYTIDAAYTLGFNKGYDEHENGGVSSPFYENAFDLNNEYSWTQIDQRHQFASSAVFFLPKGIEISTVNRFNTGRPFSPRTGVDSNRDGNNNDRPLQNGYPVPRYTFRNKGFRDTSLRVQKSFVLPNERGTLSFSAEFFNLFDFDNVEIGSNQFTYCSNAAGSQNTTADCSLNRPAANPNFGRVRDSVTGAYLTNSTLRTTPFQMQLGLRFEF
ncbi:MAG TPA: carboxypeptidase regulatory-like domain-containing protein [Terriglobia bacterium]